MLGRRRTKMRRRSTYCTLYVCERLIIRLKRAYRETKSIERNGNIRNGQARAKLLLLMNSLFFYSVEAC